MTIGLYSGPDLPSDIVGPDVIRYNGISIAEIAGREGTDKWGSATAEASWLVKGSSDPTVCRAALLDGPLLINEYDNLFIESLQRERVGPTSWIFTASYSASTPEPGEFSVTIDTTGGSVVQTYGYSQTAYAATGETAPNFGNAIDVQDGKPQGIQRVIPAMKINIRAQISQSYITSPMAYAKLLSSLTGTTNLYPFGDFDAGELLFVGATGEIVTRGDPSLTFSFLASQNVTGLTIGQITGIAKEGHEYIWFLHKPDKDGTTGLPVQSIRAAYVGKVYGAADHSVMKIGVP